MHIVAEQRNEGLLLRLVGHFNASAVEEFDRMLAHCMDQQLQFRLALDLSEVGFVSSAGLGRILAAAQKAQEHGGCLVLCCLQDDVKRVLDMSGFSTLLEISKTASAALKTLGTPGGT